MKGVFPWVLAALLAACSGASLAIPPTQGPVSTVTSQAATVTRPATATQTRTPTTTSPPTETPTATAIPCDPVVSYCIETGHLALERPIALPGTIAMDRGYPYGSTEYGTREPHHGVEFNNPFGTPVLAVADGKVVAAGDDSRKSFAIYPNTYGNLVVLEHHLASMAAPVYTLYGHLSKVEVQFGQTVRQGEEIGEVGSTGLAIGSHLHFEVREGQNDYDSNRNPALWLKPLSGPAGRLKGILAGRLEDGKGKPLYSDAVNIQYFPDRNGPPAVAWPVETYAPEAHPVGEDDTLRENLTLADLTPGDYRISLMWGGRLIERWVVVEPGSITFFIIQVDR
jgi:murein DD-endopeptidase MepM/ murein hydrolase activator NlpD